MEQLKEFVLDYYDQGGHWVYETYADQDYIDVLAKFDGDIDRACRYLKKQWKHTVDMSSNCGDY